jgi:hypothetical protein
VSIKAQTWQSSPIKLTIQSDTKMIKFILSTALFVVVCNAQFREPPQVEPQVPNFPISPPFRRQTTMQPRQPIQINGRPPLARGNWRAGVMDARCPYPDTNSTPTFLPDPRNCRKYFMCNGGYAWEMHCPPSVSNGVIWSQRDNACREVHNPMCWKNKNKISFFSQTKKASVYFNFIFHSLVSS